MTFGFLITSYVDFDVSLPGPDLLKICPAAAVFVFDPRGMPRVTVAAHGERRARAKYWLSAE